jgi:hypothetical protein
MHMFKTNVVLEPSEMLTAWRAETARLVLPTLAAPQLRQKAAVRIQIAGRPVGATIVGTIVSAHGDGRQHRIELAPDADSMRAIRLLLSAARGEPIPYMKRSLRYLVRLPVVVAAGGSDVYMNTFCVSEGGCGLKWSGPLPSVGQQLAIRLAAGARAEGVRGTVCWLSPSGPSPSAGVRLELDPAASVVWSRMFAEVARSGAPAA